ISAGHNAYPAGQIDGRRQHETIVVVRMFANQVDTTGGAVNFRFFAEMGREFLGNFTWCVRSWVGHGHSSSILCLGASYCYCRCIQKPKTLLCNRSTRGERDSCDPRPVRPRLRANHIQTIGLASGLLSVVCRISMLAEEMFF